MDVRFELNGVSFIWNDEKARRNVLNHDGITFERAAEVFFDPFIQLVDSGRNQEARDAAIGHDTQGRLLYVVHSVFEDTAIRLISARKATTRERNDHDS